MQKPMEVCYLYSARGLRTILKGGWRPNMCCSAAPWGRKVPLSMTQLFPGTCLGCPPTLQQYLVRHQPQQDVPANPWGATMGTEAVGLPRHVICSLDNWGACWRVGIWGREVLQTAVASHFPQSECYCRAEAQVHHTHGSSWEGTPPPTFFPLKEYKRIIN